MTNDKNILIKNIYYMLAYAFQVLKRNNYASIASEKFRTYRRLVCRNSIARYFVSIKTRIIS